MKRNHPASKARAKERIAEARRILRGEYKIPEEEQIEFQKLKRLEELNYLRNVQRTAKKIKQQEKEKPNGHEYRYPYKD